MGARPRAFTLPVMAGMLELITTDDHYIFHQLVQSEHALWINRHTGNFSMRASWDLAQESNPECLGAIYGLVGKLKVHPNMEDQLVVIKESEKILDLPAADILSTFPVYRVKSVALLPISASPPSTESPLKSCPKHHIGIVDSASGAEQQSSQQESDSKFPFKNLSGKFMKAGETLKSTAGTVAGGISSQVKVPWKKEKEGLKDLERVERRLLEEFLKLFNESHGFYFSYTGDLTSSLQRQSEYKELNKGLPVWRRAEDRFFYNKALLQEVIDLQDTRADNWILPLVHGFIELKDCSIEPALLAELGEDSKLPHYYKLCVISRRAHARAGTRYNRRGVDEQGKVANYVETEQIVLYHSYALSFVQIRGSIPVFWSQPGFKYRPPPRIDRSEQENLEAFTKHFSEQRELYGPVTCISLVDRNGREKILSDVFLENIAQLDEEDVSIVSFDFHEYCRGMRFENVSVLIENIQEIISRLGYFWADSHGQVCAQRGVLRVNCVDCLDRTNVVQTAIARVILETQLTKLGVVQPEHGLSQHLKMNFQSLWANNGDLMSRQYAGTNALKGDYTRTGERNISGMVKDGVNSASRYYLNHIRDSHRQAAIDALIGKEICEDLLKTDKEDVDDVDSSSNPDHVKTVIEDCKKQITQEDDEVIGGWGLIDADLVTGDPSQEGLDVVFILTKTSYFFARYDDNLDKITDYEQVNLSDITKIEFGIPEQTFPFLSKSEVHCFRVLYKVGGEEGFHHMMRSTNMKFFNNLVSVMTTEEEKVESLKAIADTVGVTMEVSGLTPNMWFGKLEKRRSKSSKPSLLYNPVNLFHMSRERSPIKLRAVGSRALSNVTSQFSKLRLNPISRLKRSNQQEFTDIRDQNVEAGIDGFEEDFDEDMKYLNSLHLPSSGLLMNGSGEEKISICVENNSISFSKNENLASNNLPAVLTLSNPPSPSPSPSRLSRKAVHGSNNLMPERSRKLSKSSEDIKSPKKLDNSFVPFSKITKSIQNLSSSRGSEASAAHYQYVSFQDTAERPAQALETPGQSQQNLTSNIETKIVKTGTKSLIMII